MKELQIMSESSRDEEGYTDTKVGVSLDFDCQLKDVGETIIKLRKIEKEMRSLYPAYETSEIEPDVNYRTGDDCYMSYGASFGYIQNDKVSSLHNIASLASAVFAYKVAEAFQDYKMDETPREIAQRVCNEQEESLLWYIGTSLYDFEVNGEDYEYEGNQKELFSMLKDESLFKEMIKILENECEGEFGFSKPFDLTIPINEYNPLKSSDETYNTIGDMCDNIKYRKLLDFFLKNIKNKG